MVIATSAWTFGWDALVAIGTLALAATTVLVAGFTYRLASKTSELAAATQADVAAQFRPVVAPARLASTVGESLWAYPGGEDSRVCGLTNIGHGPALSVGVFYSNDNLRANPSAEIPVTALAVGCTAERVTIPQPIRLNADGGFTIHVQYLSVAGARFDSEITYVPSREPGQMLARLVHIHEF